jgi:tetratricopeptide (TPR) repeat protein
MLKSILFRIGKSALMVAGIIAFMGVLYFIDALLIAFLAISADTAFGVIWTVFMVIWSFLWGFDCFDRPYSGKKIAKYDKEIQKKEMETRALYFNRGNTYKSKGDYDNAIADYEAVLHIDPDDETAKKNLEEAKNLKEQSVANNSATAE